LADTASRLLAPGLSLLIDRDHEVPGILFFSKIGIGERDICGYVA